jgi:ATP-dependent Lon protease
MVFTRNQKRKYDEYQYNTNDNDGLQIDNEFTNIKIVKKKKKDRRDNVHDQETQTVHPLIETPVNNHIIFESESDSSDDSFIVNDSYESTETQSEGEMTDETTTSVEENEQHKIEKLGEIITKTIQNILVNNTEQEQLEDGEEQGEKQKPKSRDEYDKYIRYLESIYTGRFFERVSIDEKKRTLKENYTQEQVEKLNEELEKIREIYKQSAPSVVEILQMDIDVSKKQQLLERIHQFSNSEMLSTDYVNNLKVLNDNIQHSKNTELLELEKQIMERSNDLEFSDNYKERILRSQMSLHNKIISYKRLEVMQSFESTDTSEYSKYKAWMDILLSIPYDATVGNKIENNISDVFKTVRGVLDKRLSFLERAKDQVINIVTQMARNPDFTVNAIGLHGPKGVGKTSLVKSISEALGRSYRTISLGGESDSSLLTGHGFTYVGSCPGRIIEILRETKCTNPIILFDELDKVSETHHGKEIVGNLIHMTDSSTNNKYNYDKYFAGLEFDLSKVLFIFTYNDPTKVDPILADRLFKISVDNYSTKEKLEITKTHLIKSVLDQYHFDDNNILFDEDTINYIVTSSKSDQGMRDIKRKFETITSRVNTLMLTDPQDEIVKLKYKSLYPYYKSEHRPLVILKEHVDVFLSDSASSDIKTDEPPFGMYI